jgi:hypothetical protein
MERHSLAADHQLPADSGRIGGQSPNYQPRAKYHQWRRLVAGVSHLNDLATATGSYNIGGNKLQGLGTDATTGDALSRGQSPLNSLNSPTASYSMNSQRLTGLATNTTSGDALSQPQSGEAGLVTLG